MKNFKVCLRKIRYDFTNLEKCIVRVDDGFPQVCIDNYFFSPKRGGEVGCIKNTTSTCTQVSHIQLKKLNAEIFFGLFNKDNICYSKIMKMKLNE